MVHGSPGVPSNAESLTVLNAGSSPPCPYLTWGDSRATSARAIVLMRLVDAKLEVDQHSANLLTLLDSYGKKTASYHRRLR